MSDLNLEELIAAWLDGRISQSESELLQRRLRESAVARAKFREYTRLDAAIREIASGDIPSEAISTALPVRLSDAAASSDRRKNGLPFWVQLACAAAILLIVGGIAYQLGRGDVAQSSGLIASNQANPDLLAETTLSGHATLRRVAGVQWPRGGNAYREGDVLPAGLLELDNGVAEIDFFCGATVVVEGPAKMDLESDWSVRLLAGRLRANVPPAARGFVVKAADSEIIDLGTEFALEVGPDSARVEVVDGEIRLRGGEHDGDHLVTGEGQSLRGNGADEDSLSDLSTIGDVRRQHELDRRDRFDEWKASSQKLRQDERLIAYYPIATSTTGRFIANEAVTGKELDGKLVGPVNRTRGRFGPASVGLEFDRPGARVRTRIDGEFEAFSFSCWAKIDNLEHRYNALFMADGYENGEPHWQIRDDGRLMFSVMVDDTPGAGTGPAPDARLHTIYYTDRFWDISKSGQWFHIAAVYDPIDRRVVQYVNGAQLSEEPIMDRFHVTKLRIGPAEIGNWGQPFRKTPGWVVRNLNGTIDELAIFNAALTREEIQALYDRGKPLGY